MKAQLQTWQVRGGAPRGLHGLSLTRLHACATARILAVCEAVAEERAAAGRTQEAIDILESAAAEYHAAAGGAAARLQARAAALGSAGRPAAGGGGVRALAAALAPELEVRRTSARRIE